MLDPLFHRDKNTNYADQYEAEARVKLRTTGMKLKLKENDENEDFDWWSKYYASLKVLIILKSISNTGINSCIFTWSSKNAHSNIRQIKEGWWSRNSVVCF